MAGRFSVSNITVLGRVFFFVDRRRFCLRCAATEKRIWFFVTVCMLLVRVAVL